MASALSDSRCARPRGKNGQFIKGNATPKQDSRQDSRGRNRYVFTALRTAAFRLIDHLEDALPKLEQDGETGAQTADEKAGETAAESAPDQTEKSEKPKWSPADYSRLLGRNGGVIDGFRTLADLILRLTELEQKRRAPAQSILDFTEDDEDDLDRRIADELDRLAERGGPANHR